MSDQATVDVVSNEDTIKAAVLATQMAIIDVAVRQARTQSWCGEFERIMGQLFPDGPPDGSKEFTDSDGWSCRGLDRDGFNRNGYDSDGFMRDGYSEPAPDGRDRQGLDRQGWSRDGYGRDGFHRETGRDRAGFDRDGVHTTGVRRDSDEYRARFRFDRNGYDRDGFTRTGRNRQGLTREQVAEYGEQLFVYEWDENYGLLLTPDRRTTDGYAAEGDGPYVQPTDYALLQRLSNR